MKSLKRSWLGKACWGCLFSLIDRDYLNSTYSVYKLQLEQLCDFVPSDRFFSFLSHLCLSPNFSDGKSERRALVTSRWKPPISGGGGRISGHPFAQEASPGKMLSVTEAWDAVLSLDVKSRRGKGSAPNSLTAVCSTRLRLQGHTDWAWGFQQCP